MTRPRGSRNIQPFGSRTVIATTATQEIQYLVRQVNHVPREQFKALLSHQRGFLNWIDTRHQQLLAAKRQLDPCGRGPKDAVYRKYRWYAEQQSLLEVINAFEAFYKNTLINLGDAIQSYVPPDKIKGDVDAKTIWAIPNPGSAAALIFEHQLFHNLRTVDDATNMLVGARRYCPDNTRGAFYARVKSLQAVFQIRHTLSHNQGHVTQSDAAKFAALGYSVAHGEVLDPSNDHLGAVVGDLLLQEASEFTDWILDKAAEFLTQRTRDSGTILLAAHREAIVQSVGTRPSITGLSWQ